MSKTGKIIRVNALPPAAERETNIIYQVAAPGAANYTEYAIDASGDLKMPSLDAYQVSISDSGSTAEGITTQAEYNINTRLNLNNKLDRPFIEGNVQDYNTIIGLNDAGQTVRLPAAELARNVANTSLISVPGAGLTLGADWSMNTAGFNYAVTGLVNASGDNSFTKSMVAKPDGTIGWADRPDTVADTSAVSLYALYEMFPDIIVHRNTLSRRGSFVALYFQLSTGSEGSTVINSNNALGIIPSEYRPTDDTLIPGNIKYMENSQWINKPSMFLIEASSGQITLTDSLPDNTEVTLLISTQYIQI